MKAEVDSLEKEFSSQSLMLSDARKTERKALIDQKKADYETFTQSVWGPQGKIAAKNSELVQPIVEKINVVLKRIGDEEGYTLVLDAAVGESSTRRRDRSDRARSRGAEQGLETTEKH